MFWWTTIAEASAGHNRIRERDFNLAQKWSNHHKKPAYTQIPAFSHPPARDSWQTGAQSLSQPTLIIRRHNTALRESPATAGHTCLFAPRCDCHTQKGAQKVLLLYLRWLSPLAKSDADESWLFYYL